MQGEIFLLIPSLSKKRQRQQSSFLWVKVLLEAFSSLTILNDILNYKTLTTFLHGRNTRICFATGSAKSSPIAYSLHSVHIGQAAFPV